MYAKVRTKVVLKKGPARWATSRIASPFRFFFTTRTKPKGVKSGEVRLSRLALSAEDGREGADLWSALPFIRWGKPDRAMHLLNEQGREKIRDIQNVRDIRESLAGATQGTTTKTGPEDPAHDSRVPEMSNRVNKCQFDQITKRRNYKRSLLKCVDAMAQRKVLLCPCSTIFGVCD